MARGGCKKYTPNHRSPSNTSGKQKPRRLNKKPRKRRRRKRRRDSWDDEGCR